MFRAIIDLSHSISENAPNWEGTPHSLRTTVTASHAANGYFVRKIALDEHSSTHMDAPAHMGPGMWTIDEVPAERLVCPLIVLDVRDKVHNNDDYLICAADIAAWEAVHGTIPHGAVVIARTGWDERWPDSRAYRNADAGGTLHFPAYALEAAEFLVESRKAFGIGIDTLSVDSGASQDYAVHRFCAMRNVYHLENVANLENAPPVGALAVVAPAKIDGGSGAPVRVFALIP